MIDISVVIPTCNRRARLLSLLADLRRSTLPPREILVVDSSDDPLRHRRSARGSACCARKSPSARSATAGSARRRRLDFSVRRRHPGPARLPEQLAAHIDGHPEAGAVSGLVLEKVGGRWIGQHPTTSAAALLWCPLFQLGLWGEIHCHGLVGDLLAAHYRSRGNHISSAGWPVLTDFSGPFFRTPSTRWARRWSAATGCCARRSTSGWTAAATATTTAWPSVFPPKGSTSSPRPPCTTTRSPADRPPPAVAYSAASWPWICSAVGTRARVGQPRRLAWSVLGNACCTPRRAIARCAGPA